MTAAATAPGGGGFVGEWLGQRYVERRNVREAEHCLQNLKEIVESRA